MCKKITFLLLACFGLLTFSCKKEYVKFPYSDIESFTIKDTTGTPLKAILENGNIIVYWPPFQTVPDSIAPQIIVSDRATVTPASGKKVPFNTSVTYTVTAQDGSTRKYTLKPAVNQPRLTGLNFYLGEVAGSNLGINGEYFIPDTNVTKLFLINQQSNKETRIWASTFNEFTAVSLNVYSTPLTLDTGVYKIKFINGTQTVISGNFHISPPVLRPEDMVFPDQGKTLKRGDAITFNFASGSTLAKYYINMIGGISIGTDEGPLIISVSSQNASGAKFIIPANCPTGPLYYFSLIDKTGRTIGVLELSGNKQIIISL